MASCINETTTWYRIMASCIMASPPVYAVEDATAVKFGTWNQVTKSCIMASPPLYAVEDGCIMASPPVYAVEDDLYLGRYLPLILVDKLLKNQRKRSKKGRK